eukprot:3872548-Amphidinium_carterae.1
MLHGQSQGPCSIPHVDMALRTRGFFFHPDHLSRHGFRLNFCGCGASAPLSLRKIYSEKCCSRY